MKIVKELVVGLIVLIAILVGLSWAADSSYRTDFTTGCVASGGVVTANDTCYKIKN